MKKTFYDDAGFSYPAYWRKRKYEHLSEKIAIEKFITFIPPEKRDSVIDVGAGFGRLSKTYTEKFKQCFLLDPSQKLIDMAKKNVKEKNVIFRIGAAEKIPFDDQQFDLVLMVRVAHHLNDFSKIITEVCRVLKPGGFFILEFANKTHFKAKVTSLFNQRVQKSISHLSPIDIRHRKNKITIPFLNYHPRWVLKLGLNCGFSLVRKFSVSNFRSSILKKVIPLNILLWVEDKLQFFLGKLNFGPSIFILLQKS